MYSHTDVNKFKDLVKVFWETGAIPYELVETAVRLLKNQLTEQNSPSAKAPQDKPANLITRKKAAELLCCCTRTIDRLREKGILKAVQYGTKSVRYREPDILSLQNGVLEQEESAKE